MTFVLRILFNFCRRPGLRFGLAKDPQRRFRNAQFASFLTENNRHRLNSDFQDTVLRGRKLVRTLFFLLLGGGGIWVVVESARALTIF